MANLATVFNLSFAGIDIPEIPSDAVFKGAELQADGTFNLTFQQPDIQGTTPPPIVITTCIVAGTHPHRPAVVVAG